MNLENGSKRKIKIGDIKMENRFEELRKNFLPRFWDTLEKEMVYPVKDKGIIGYKPSTVDSVVRIDVMLQDRFIPMRPTGVVDRKGTLICEEDIVKLSSLVELVRGQGTYWKNLRLVVKFKNQSFYPDRLKESEVIGNIHENPELLELEK